jgi:hypothetical protein
MTDKKEPLSEAAKTRLLILRLFVITAIAAMLFVGCQEMKAAETRIQDHTESIIDQVGP